MFQDSAGHCAVGVRYPIALWVPSQNGLIADFPQRHSATVVRSVSSGVPSGWRSSKSPRNSNGPSG